MLTPTIRLLETEIEAIKENKIFWHRYTSGKSGFNIGLSKLLSDNKNEFAVRDIISKFPELDQMFFSHDDLYDKLNALYAKIENEVKSPELKDRLETLVKKFNEPRVGGHILRGDSFDDPDRYFGAFIINHNYPIERSPGSIQPKIDFWEEYRDELLKFRDTPQITELDEEIGDTLGQLQKLDEALLEKLEKIRGEYRVKHNFTKYEIDPELKKLEGW